MATKQQPSEALLKDLKTVFDKHAWPGHAVGVRALAADPGGGECTPPQTPHEISYLDENGTWVTKTVCL